MQSRHSVVVATLVLLLNLAPAVALAVPGLVAVVPEECGGADAATKCNVCSIGVLANNVLNDAIFILVVFSAIAFAWAGVLLLTSRGDKEQMKTAKKIFNDVLIGLVTVLVAWLVVNVIVSTLTTIGDWSHLC